MLAAAVRLPTIVIVQPTLKLTYQHLKHARPSICTCMLVWSVVHISTWICIYSLHLSGHSLVIVNAWAVHINLMVNAGA
jgi:hypothetical protein